MRYVLRDYQKRASDAAVSSFGDKKNKNGIIVLPTGSGKSLVISDIASRLDSPLLIFCPSKEILEQNYAKIRSYDIFDVGIYSASVGKKNICRITLATIKSVYNHMEDFRCFRYVLIDECHQVSAISGQYKSFIEDVNRKVIGLTATPYRLYSSGNGYSQLKFLTRTRPRIFQNVLYYCQVYELLSMGFLANLNYYDLTTLDMRNVRSNSTGADYDDDSLSDEYNRSGFYRQLVDVVERLLKPKSGIPRRGILVFTRFVREAESLACSIPRTAIVSSNTPKKQREAIIEQFKCGKIKVVANVGTLTTGFDYPELDTILIARPTKSLALYYQMVGRAIRPHNNKRGWIVDLCGNIKRFGKVEDLMLTQPDRGKWCITSRGRLLTNTYL